MRLQTGPAYNYASTKGVTVGYSTVNTVEMYASKEWYSTSLFMSDAVLNYASKARY